MAEEIEAFRALFKRNPGPLTIEIIADELGVSVRTVRRRITALQETGLLVARSDKGTNYYTWAESHVSDSTAEPALPMTKTEEIVERAYRYRNLLDDTIIRRLRDDIRKETPESLRKELADFLEDESRALEQRRDDESKERREHMRDDLRIIRSMTFIDKVKVCPDDGLPRDRVVSGTDASRDLLEVVWKLGLVPIQLKLMVISTSAVIADYKKDQDLPGFKYQDEPKFPISAGQSFIEELSTRYPNLDEGEKNVLSLILMNTTHFAFDRQVITDVKPAVHFHDGRLLPPHMSYLDFLPQHRREALWQCFDAALALKESSRRMGATLCGVTKTAHSETEFFSKLLRMRLAKQIGSEYELPVPETGAVDALMDENEMSWITVTRPRRSYLPPEEEEKAKKIMTEADLDRYKKHLDDSEYSFFFIKHAREGVARYDFFNPATEADALLTRDRIAGVASKTAVPLVGGQSHLLRQIAFVPNVVSFADDRARMWARTVSAQLFQYMRSKLLR